MAHRSMELREAMSPAHESEPMADTGPIEAHIVKKYGKFHGHVKMADGAEHHMPPAASMHEAHAAMAEHMGAPAEYEEE